MKIDKRKGTLSKLSVPFAFVGKNAKIAPMHRLPSITVIALCLSIFAVGQDKREPAFTSYKEPVEKAQAKSINFKNDQAARTFRTRLSEALKGGVNFAGHYIVT